MEHFDSPLVFRARRFFSDNAIDDGIIGWNKVHDMGMVHAILVDQQLTHTHMYIYIYIHIIFYTHYVIKLSITGI